MRILKRLGLALAVLVLVLLGAGYALLRASLPQLDGTRIEAALSAPVRITRDARGMPTLAAATRADLAFATGFLHAQDRFFQMDLSRRFAAGELSELFGAVALGQDRRTRLFRFRSVAQAVIAAATPQEQAIVEAYARGVNAGLAGLRARPWEYLVLGARPVPWRPEDSLLVAYAMWWDLQAGGLRRGILRRQIDARLGGPACGEWKCALSFLYPSGTSWDAPDGDGPALGPVAAIPDAAALNVRGRPAPAAALRAHAEQRGLGSNNWVVSGRLTANGAALVANDMHLGLRVPAVWYPARLTVAAGGAQPAVDATGVTLPGTPMLIAGSNGHIAWGFTNSYGTWLDVGREECTAAADGAIGTAQGPLAVVRETIHVHGAPDEVLDVRSGAAGVLLRADPARHECWFGAWLARNPEASNMHLLQLETAASVEEALALAPGMGMPHQNFVVGDAAGHIAWSIFGRIPEDTGPGRARGGAPWTSAADHPRIVDPPSGRIWSANARVAADPQQQRLIGGALAELGAEYDLGARARQIRDDLAALTPPIAPGDMLRVQLDDRALFLERWHALLLGLLDAPALEGSPARTEFRRLIEQWGGAARVDSAGYRLVRAFHDQTQDAVWSMLLGALQLAGGDDEDDGPPAQFEEPLWRLVVQQPQHLLASRYSDWKQFLRAQVDATIESLRHECPRLADCTWGAHDVVHLRHPLSRALPALSWLIDMPAVELPGDHNMPRVQDRTLYGASERFAVSPGHEAQGYLELPGGQSGHPLSPYYRSGFDAWVRGERPPFLPGLTEHSLTLQP